MNQYLMAFLEVVFVYDNVERFVTWKLKHHGCEFLKSI